MNTRTRPTPALNPRPGDTTVPMGRPHGPDHWADTQHTPTAPSRASRRRHPVLRTIGVIAASLFAGMIALVVVAIIWGKAPITVIKGDGTTKVSAAACQPYQNWPGSDPHPVPTTDGGAA
jgi:hypothetical protein